jgi:putative ABC transport system permease protein
MMSILRGVSLRRFVEHGFRTFLTVLGIGLGVAAYVSVTILTATITDSFTKMIDLVAGKVSLQVTGGPTGVEEAVLEAVQKSPEVQAAVPTIQTYTKTKDGQAMMILAVDTINDRLVRDYKMEDASGSEISDPLVFLNSRNAILMNKDFARANGVAIDSTIELMTSQGRLPFIVRGLLDPKGTAEAFGGRFALMDVYAAQLHFGKQGRFDSIDVLLKEGAKVDPASAAIKAALGGKYEVQRPSQKTEGVENMMSSFNQGLEILSLVVILMGTFIIFNTVYTSVFQRKREIGMLRMIGVTRPQILALFCFEGTLLGLLGSALGVAGGYLMGRYAVTHYAGMVSSIYVMVDVSKAAFRWSFAWVGVVMGTGVAFLASLYPAWRATTFTPVEVVRFGVSLSTGKDSSLARYGFLLVLSAAALAAGLYLPGIREQLDGVRIAMIATLVLAVAVSPFFIKYFVLAVGRAEFGRAGSLRRLAAENIQRDLHRSAMTVAAFMLGLAVMLEVYIFSNSMKHEIKGWMDEALNADLVVTSSSSLANRSSIPVRRSLAEPMRAIQGVDWVSPVRMNFVDYGKSRIVLLSRNWEKHVTPLRFKFVERYVPDPVADLNAQKGVILSQSFISRNPEAAGARSIRLATPSGEVDFPVLGVSNEYTSEAGTVIFAEALFLKHYRDELADSFLIFLAPGADMAAVRQKIYDLLGDDFNLFVLTNREMKVQILDAIDQMFSLTYALEVIAMIIAFIGIVNNLMTTVMDRTREIGVLRAIGATRGQVARIFVGQAAMLGFSGGLISIAAGFILGAIHVSRLTKLYGGWVMPMQYSWSYIAGSVAAAVAVGLVAGFLPARRAAGLLLHESLKYE